MVRAAVAANNGFEVQTDGDGFFVAFGDATDAVAACVNAQQSLTRHGWPLGGEIRVRMGLHTGVATPTPEGDYVALAVHQAARVVAAAHGGQVLLSAQTAGLLRNALPLGTSLAQCGRFVLKDFDEQEPLYQLLHPDLQASFPPLRASPAIPHNLPDVRSSFVGRHGEMLALDELLAANRLVSVVGPGGVGKTRLCVELAARSASHFGEGACLADLSPLSDPSLVDSIIAAAFGVRDMTGSDVLGTVCHGLAGREVLLVMDNCEHVLDAAASAADLMLSATSGLRILATSREALGVTGEQIWPLAPLSVPDKVDDAVGNHESVRLFEDRARLALPGFSLTSQNAAAVTSICRHLEGLPLAIELVAARVSTMSLATIAAHLESGVDSASGWARRKAGRHGSLETTIDWSYQLLDETDQKVFRALSIFAGGFTGDGVHAIVHTERPLDRLAGLVEKSLVVYDVDVDRYRLLETIRAFGRVRLDQAGETDSVASEHLRFYAAVADDSYASALTSRDAHTFAMVDREIDNMRAACAWAEQHAAPEGLRLVGGLFLHWFYRAPAEGRTWADRLLAAVPQDEPSWTGMLLAVRSVCSWAMGDAEGALKDSERAVAVLRGSDDRGALAQALMAKAVASGVSDPVGSKAIHLEAWELASRQGVPMVEVAVLNNLSSLEKAAGNYAAALEYAEQGMAALATSDPPAASQAVIRLNLGFAMLHTGTPPPAVHPIFGEAFEWATQIRSPMILAWCIEGLAATIATSNPEQSARLLGVAETVRFQHNVGIDDDDKAEIEATRRLVDNQLGPERTSELMSSVRDVSLEQAIEIARTQSL